MKSTEPEFWETRYRTGKMPWDAHGVPQALQVRLRTARSGRVLIPGCGSGYEVRAFAERGWEVLAVDFSPAAIARSRQVLGPLADRVWLADFFTQDFGGDHFDVVYERTFLCSLPPDVWPKYARRMAELLRPGGQVIGFFLYGHEDEPPPYPLAEADAQTLFGAQFIRLADEPVTDSLPLFAGRERWQVWEKK
jgi:SAM-dependent methyltransferase